MNSLINAIDNISWTDSSTASLIWQKDKNIRKYTWGEEKKIIYSIALFLQEKKFNNTNIAILADNQPSWSLVDVAIILSGNISTPIYPGISHKEMLSVLNIAKPKLIFIDTNNLLKYINIIQTLDFIDQVILIDNNKEKKKFESLDSISQLYSINQLKKLNITRNEKEVVSLIFTSGTTGEPKAVSLTLEMIDKQINNLTKIISVSSFDKSIALMPYSHIFARLQSWGHFTHNFKNHYIDDLNKFSFYFEKIKPSFLLLVPRLIEKIYQGILNDVSGIKLKKSLLNNAINVSEKVSSLQQNKRLPSLGVLLKYSIAKKLVFPQIINFFGGELKYIISSGAKLEKEVHQFFNTSGIKILEAWGLSEVGGAVTINRPYDYKIGSVGRPINKGVKLEIAEDGEILVKDESLKWNDTELDENGFFHTGDIGSIDNDEFVTIKERKKDLIKTSGGKYVAPQKLSKLLEKSPYINYALVIGDNKKYIVCLISLSEKSIKKYAIDNRISFQSIESLSKSRKINLLIKQHIAEINEELASYETIKNYKIVSSSFSIETGELTPTLKVKRKFCENKYKHDINNLYGDI